MFLFFNQIFWSPTVTNRSNIRFWVSPIFSCFYIFRIINIFDLAVNSDSFLSLTVVLTNFALIKGVWIFWMNFLKNACEGVRFYENSRPRPATFTKNKLIHRYLPKILNRTFLTYKIRATIFRASLLSKHLSLTASERCIVYLCSKVVTVINSTCLIFDPPYSLFVV